jgi:hypothetical protein
MRAMRDYAANRSWTVALQVKVRIPRDGDQHSEVMSIRIPK